jgi:photosystem II stability/assembly factor-like uncharacterized protein
MFKIKKTIQIIFVLATVLFLSGCSVISKPQGGFYKSVNGGETFFQEETESSEILNGVSILSMEINPNNDQEVFVGTARSGLFKTINEGKDWLGDVNNFGNVHDIEIISGTSIMYIVAKKDGLGKLFKSENNGDSWTAIYNEKDASSYLTSVEVDKYNKNIIYIANSKGGLFKSEDEGQTWRNLYWAKSSINKIESDNVNPSIIYLATARNGLDISRDGGEKFKSVMENDLVYNILPHPNREGFIYASTREGLMRSLNYGDNWDTLNTLIKSEEIVAQGIAINPQNPSKIYFTSGLTFYKSFNEGKTWSTKQFNPSNFIEVIKINPNNPEKIYLGANKNNNNNFKINPFLN